MAETRITKIPFPGGSGLTPTGAMEFEKDWPGLFIRGDSAIPLANAIKVQVSFQEKRWKSAS